MIIEPRKFSSLKINIPAFLKWILSIEIVSFWPNHPLMNRNSLLFIAVSLLIFFSCKEQDSRPDARLNQPEAFKKLLDAHGDWQKWVEAKAFSYAMVHETTLEWENHYFNLQTGQARIDADLWQAGNDGQKVWISPNRQVFPGQSVQFYHKLYFTFFSLPYVLTDTTVTVKPVEKQLVNGQAYETLEADLGETYSGPSNKYRLLINPETGRLEWVIFSVTFNNTTAEPNILKYDDYRDADGLIFPRVITGYDFANDSVGKLRYQVSFSDVFLVDKEMDNELFAMPKKQAVVAN